MKESKLFSMNNKNMKKDVSKIKQIPPKFKVNLISLNSLPNTQVITGSKSFRQKTRCFTQKNSKKKDKKPNILESVSFDLNSKCNECQKRKNKQLIVDNIKNCLNYNSKLNPNILNYTKPSSNNSNNNNGKKPNLLYIQKIEEEPQLRINTVINSIGPSFSTSANNSISNKNKNKKNINNPNYKLFSYLTGWNSGFKGDIKGYNTANNTANNSVTGSKEKYNKKKLHNKTLKKNSYKKNGKDNLKTKDAINNNVEFNLQNKSIKNKFAHTTNNSRQNSGEKYIDSKNSKLLASKHNKLLLNNIRDFNNNIYNKPISTQTTIDNKIKKNIINEKKNIKSESKGMIIKNNNCQNKNQIIRNNNQESIKLSYTNEKGKLKIMNSKTNSENIILNSDYLKAKIYSNLKTKTNSAFSTRQNIKVENSQIKVNKSNKMLNNNENNNKGNIIKSKYKNKNLKNIDVLNINEESLEIIKNQNQKNSKILIFLI